MYYHESLFNIKQLKSFTSYLYIIVLMHMNSYYIKTNQVFKNITIFLIKMFLIRWFLINSSEKHFCFPKWNFFSKQFKQKCFFQNIFIIYSLRNSIIKNRWFTVVEPPISFLFQHTIFIFWNIFIFTIYSILFFLVTYHFITFKEKYI